MLGRVRPEKVYAARVQGDSMIDEHICDGDIALIENRPEARDGEIVVALVDETYATLKRLYKHGAEVELRPSNSQLESIRVPARNVRVQGIFRVFCARQSKTRVLLRFLAIVRIAAASLHPGNSHPQINSSSTISNALLTASV